MVFVNKTQRERGSAVESFVKQCQGEDAPEKTENGYVYVREGDIWARHELLSGLVLGELEAAPQEHLCRFSPAMRTPGPESVLIWNKEPAVLRLGTPDLSHTSTVELPSEFERIDRIVGATVDGEPGQSPPFVFVVGTTMSGAPCVAVVSIANRCCVDFYQLPEGSRIASIDFFDWLTLYQGNAFADHPRPNKCFSPELRRNFDAWQLIYQVDDNQQRMLLVPAPVIEIGEAKRAERERMRRSNSR